MRFLPLLTAYKKRTAGGTVRRKGVVKAQSGITIDELTLSMRPL